MSCVGRRSKSLPLRGLPLTHKSPTSYGSGTQMHDGFLRNPVGARLAAPEPHRGTPAHAGRNPPLNVNKFSTKRIPGASELDRRGASVGLCVIAGGVAAAGTPPPPAGGPPPHGASRGLRPGEARRYGVAAKAPPERGGRGGARRSDTRRSDTRRSDTRSNGAGEHPTTACGRSLPPM